MAMKRLVAQRAVLSMVAVGVVGISGIAGVGVASPASATSISTAPYCGIYWGSQDKHDDPMLAVGPVLNVRAGRHDCYDRLVIDQSGKTNHFLVGYVDQVRADGSGAVVPLRGGAYLQIVLAAEIDYPSKYNPVDRTNLVDVAGYQTFRQVAAAGAFEGVVSYGLGVRARLPFRAFTLDGPGAGSRLVVDVAHRW